MIPHPGMFVKTNILKEIKFDESYKIAADFKLFLRLFYNRNYRFKFSDLIVLYFGLEGVSSCNDATTEIVKIYEELGLVYPSEDKTILKRAKTLLNLIMTEVLIIGYKIIFLGYKKHKCKNEICRWCGR